ncbi:MAG: 30S ribosomal protein S3 [Thermoplasmata archaeon]
MASERKFVTEKIRRVLLKEYVMSKVSRAGFGGLDVQRTPMGTRVTLITERPGLVIGRRGEAIKSLTKAIETDFNFSNPQIEVQEVESPNLNAQIMAEKLASALERGWHFRRAGHSTVRRIMESGARGCQVTVAGKLTGRRHRREKFKNGHIKFCGQAKLDFMERGFASARMKPGVIGVTVQIMHPDARLPDEIDIIPPPEPVATPTEPVVDAGKEREAKEEERAAEAVEKLKKAVDDEEDKPKKAASKPKTAASKPRKKKEKAPSEQPEAEEGKKSDKAASDKPASETPTETKAIEPAKPKAVIPVNEKPVEPATEGEPKAEPETAPKAEPAEKQPEPDKKKDEKPSEEK